jgi:cell division protein ZapE
LLQAIRDPVFLSSGNAKHTMESMFRRLTMGRQAAPVEVGRVQAKCAVQEIAWFDFKTLCGGNHDQTDYLQIAHRYPTLFLSDVPRMTLDNADESRRFTWLIDVLYDNRVKLVANFAASPEELYQAPDGESVRITSRLIEMQTQRYLGRVHQSRNMTLTGT